MGTRYNTRFLFYCPRCREFWQVVGRGPLKLSQWDNPLPGSRKPLGYRRTVWNDPTPGDPVRNSRTIWAEYDPLCMDELQKEFTNPPTDGWSAAIVARAEDEERRTQAASSRAVVKRCLFCGKAFRPARADALHCSGACRQRWYRRKKRQEKARESREIRMRQTP